MTLKRKRSDNALPLSLAKRPRVGPVKHISDLSDELILKILANLPISDLVGVQRVSHKWQRLASDSEVWKQKYYARWVRPRALRIPRLRDTTSAADSLNYSSQLARWLDHSHQARSGQKTDWKRQYRLRYNWWRGTCREKNLEVAEPPTPSVLVKMHDGLLFTVGASHGLRAWTAKENKFLLAEFSVLDYQTNTRPASLGVDVSTRSPPTTRVSVGFTDGSFHLYNFDKDRVEFSEVYAHPPSTNSSVSAIAISWPYVLTMSQSKILSLYSFSADHALPVCVLPARVNAGMRPPKLLASLQSDAAYAPLSLSIRIFSWGVKACIAYAFSRFPRGWSVGLQEVLLTAAGDPVLSRMTSTIDCESHDVHRLQNPPSSIAIRSVASQPFALHPHIMARPLSLSYSHPYLLASLPDNTLMVYLVVSDADQLVIASGRRLWGHTSSVSGIEVSDRGRAVSVSAQGTEMRVWDLEDVVTSSTPRRASVRITPATPHSASTISDAIARRGNGIGLALKEVQAELAGVTPRPITRSWVGFDEEQVVVLGQMGDRQILSCYDFT